MKSVIQIPDFKKFIKHANKEFGQNFLLDTNILTKIVECVEDDISNKICVEIGGGIGNLTYFILNKQPKKLIIIEKDTKYYEHLNNFLNSDLINLVSGQTELIIKNADCLIEPIDTDIIISNLPYNISQLFLLKVTEKDKYKKMIVLLQKEVGQKLIAKTGNKHYGAISVIMQITHHIKIVFDVSAKCFNPAPSVTSSLVYFERINYELFGNIFLKFQNFVFNIFKQRRKKLKNILSFKLDEDISNKRPEELSPIEYFNLFKLNNIDYFK